MIRPTRVLLALLLSACGALAPNGAEGQDSRGASWVTLGTCGGPQVRAERAQIANALELEDRIYLFDTGNDVQRQMAGSR